MNFNAVGKFTTIIVITASVVIFVLVGFSCRETTLQFKVEDAVSKQWVWDADISVQNKVIQSFYQSDKEPRIYKFTGLKPGKSELLISAPGYISKKVPLDLRRGQNSIPTPIEMTGYEIEGLDKILIFESVGESGVAVEVRPVGADGRAIANHPCLSIQIGARVSEQIKDGKYIRESVHQGASRGKSLYQDVLQWEFDASPEALFRYAAFIPRDEISQTEAAFYVIDYLVIIPDSRIIDSKKLDSVVEMIKKEKEFEKVFSKLESFHDSLRYFYITKWNVRKS